MRSSRELDFISDIAKLERKTWNSPVIAPFSSTSLIQELTDRCSVSLQARNIKFCCEYQSGLPESLNGCRELLYQLLHLLVRFVSRSLAGNSQVTFAASGRKGDAVFEIRDRNCDEHRELLAANYLKASERGDIPDPEKCSLSVIGLEIVRNIAEKTGCSLEVESGNGSLTILRLIVPGSAADHTNGALAGIVRHETRFTPAPADEDEQLTVLMSAEDHEEAAAVAMLLAHSNIKIVSFPDNSTLLQNVEKTPDVSGIIIAAPFTQDSPPQSYIPQIRRLAGVSVLPVLVITPVYSKELALELAAIPQVTGLVQPLNYAQVVHLLRGTPPGKG